MFNLPIQLSDYLTSPVRWQGGKANMVRFIHHKFILFAISLLFLGVAAVPNVKLAVADEDQAVIDLNDLDREAADLRRAARGRAAKRYTLHERRCAQRAAWPV